MTSEMMPCPFCGPHKHDSHAPQAIKEDGTNLWQVCCWGCGSTGAFRNTRAEAITAWNTRASHAKLRAALEEIRDLTAADGGLPILAAHDIARRALEES